MTRQRVYATLLALGACILLYRTLALLWGGVLTIWVPWASGLLILEMAIDLGTLLLAIRWGISGSPSHDVWPLRLGAAAALVHAFRVLLFVLGRSEAFWNFDVRPEYWADHHTRWHPWEVVFASIMSVLGVLGVVVIAWLRHRSRRPTPKQDREQRG